MYSYIKFLWTYSLSIVLLPNWFLDFISQFVYICLPCKFVHYNLINFEVLFVIF